MIDFSPIREKKTTWARFSKQFTKEDLMQEMEEATALMLEILSKATDEDVAFVPVDEAANDTFADSDDIVDLAWTLGHVVVHTTASTEEASFIAAELARGVEIEARRSRVEVDWETVTTIKQCRDRVNESHRMVMGSLAIWPDEPQLDNFYTSPQGNDVSTRFRFLYGLIHADSHYEQMKEIIRQSRQARKIA